MNNGNNNNQYPQAPAPYQQPQAPAPYQQPQAPYQQPQAPYQQPQAPAPQYQQPPQTTPIANDPMFQQFMNQVMASSGEAAKSRYFPPDHIFEVKPRACKWIQSSKSAEQAYVIECEIVKSTSPELFPGMTASQYIGMKHQSSPNNVMNFLKALAESMFPSEQAKRIAYDPQFYQGTMMDIPDTPYGPDMLQHSLLFLETKSHTTRRNTPFTKHFWEPSQGQFDQMVKVYQQQQGNHAMPPGMAPPPMQTAPAPQPAPAPAPAPAPQPMQYGPGVTPPHPTEIE
jgi:hypothetical protein